MAARFFCPTLPHPRLSDPRCLLGPDETRHARKVLRIPIGDTVELFDGAGGVGTALVEDYTEQGMLCRVTAVTEAEVLLPRITVACAVPKGSRAEDMVNQLSQLGADRLIPMVTKYSVVDPREGKVDRFRRVAVEAAKQSGRLTLMQIDPVADFGNVLAQVCDFGVICTPRGDRPADMAQELRDCQHAMVMIGPEGGFSDDELHRAKHAGYQPWCISPNVLRIETAATAAVSLLRYLS